MCELSDAIRCVALFERVITWAAREYYEKREYRATVLSHHYTFLCQLRLYL